MVHKLVNILYIQSFEKESLCNTYFDGLRGRQTQGPPQARPHSSYATGNVTKNGKALLAKIHEICGEEI